MAIRKAGQKAREQQMRAQIHEQKAGQRQMFIQATVPAKHDNSSPAVQGAAESGQTQSHVQLASRAPAPILGEAESGQRMYVQQEAL